MSNGNNLIVHILTFCYCWFINKNSKWQWCCAPDNMCFTLNRSYIFYSEHITQFYSHCLSILVDFISVRQSQKDTVLNRSFKFLGRVWSSGNDFHWIKSSIPIDQFYMAKYDLAFNSKHWSVTWIKSQPYTVMNKGFNLVSL